MKYSYAAFCEGIYERDGDGCYLRRVLVARRRAQIERWGGGQGENGDSRNWIPLALLECDGPLDGMHWVPKQWLKREGFAACLSDPANGSLGCRRHHSMMDRKLLVVRGGDVPAHVWEFARALGDRVVLRLEREYVGRAPVSPVELRTGG